MLSRNAFILLTMSPPHTHTLSIMIPSKGEMLPHNVSRPTLISNQLTVNQLTVGLLFRFSVPDSSRWCFAV